MRRVLAPLALFALALVGLVAAGPWSAVAQHGSPTAGHAGGHGAGTPTTSPYAPGFDPAAAIRALSPEEIAQIERGEGAGFAKAAELNGVPGPRHVLGLSHDQLTRVQAIEDGMTAAVLAAGERYLAAQRRLEEDFRAGSIAREELPGRVAEVYRLEGELTAAHLAAHLDTAAVLTPEQIATYNRLRGYA